MNHPIDSGRRGFADTKVFDFLDTLGLAYVIRFRGNIHVSSTDGETRPAAAWGGKGGRARALRAPEATAREIGSNYATRWTVEPGFRDTKDLRFGMGLSVLRIADPQRRDRLLLLNAFPIVLLTLLGAAGESLGMDRRLKVKHHQTPNPFVVSARLHAV